MALCFLDAQEMIKVIGALIQEHVLIKLGIDAAWLKSHRGWTAKDVIEKKVGRVPQSSTPIGVMIDGSTHSARKDQHIVFARSTVAGRLETLFLGVRPVDDGGSASITATLLSIIDDSFIDRSRVVILATDGAKPMIGEHTGVGARLRQISPFLIQVHCINHRYETTRAF